MQKLKEWFFSELFLQDLFLCGVTVLVRAPLPRLCSFFGFYVMIIYCPQRARGKSVIFVKTLVKPFICSFAQHSFPPLKNNFLLHKNQ